MYDYDQISESLVLTEDDHWAFLKNISRGLNSLPPQIQEALAETSLLFIGYSLQDWTFRMLRRGIIESTDLNHFPLNFIQHEPPNGNSVEKLEQQEGYMNTFLADRNGQISWGTVAEFAGELRQRWEQSGYPQKSIVTTAQIFLSYAREDEAKVKELYQKLSKAGLKPWIDIEDLLPGDRWKASIKKAIQNSDFFLACVSNTSVNKRGYLQREIKEALDFWQEKLEDDIYFIPVKLEDCLVPDNLQDFQWVNLYEKNGLEKLIQAIQVCVNRRTG